MCAHPCTRVERQGAGAGPSWVASSTTLPFWEGPYGLALPSGWREELCMLVVNGRRMSDASKSCVEEGGRSAHGGVGGAPGHPCSAAAGTAARDRCEATACGEQDPLIRPSKNSRRLRRRDCDDSNQDQQRCSEVWELRAATCRARSGDRTAVQCDCGAAAAAAVTALQ